MTDSAALIARLRNVHAWQELCHEAADHIAALERELEQARHWQGDFMEACAQRDKAEAKALRETLNLVDALAEQMRQAALMSDWPTFDDALGNLRRAIDAALAGAKEP